MKNLKRLLLAKLSVKTLELSPTVLQREFHSKSESPGFREPFKKKRKKKRLCNVSSDIERTLEFNMATALEGPGIDEKIIGDIISKVSL